MRIENAIFIVDKIKVVINFITQKAFCNWVLVVALQFDCFT